MKLFKKFNSSLLLGLIIISSLNGQWSLLKTIEANDNYDNDGFGKSVDISGDYAIVGVEQRSHPNKNNVGAAYIYYKASSGWEQQVKLTASDVNAGDLFGRSVAIYSNASGAVYAAVGATGYDNSEGLVYVFKRDGTSWSQVDRLSPNSNQWPHLFGESVSIGYYQYNGVDYHTIAVGAYNDGTDLNNKPGALYIFQATNTATYPDKFYNSNTCNPCKPSDLLNNDQFGRSVDISGKYIIAGAPADDESGYNNSGAAYIYTVDSDNKWIYQAKLQPSDIFEDKSFGWSVSIDGDYAIIGASDDDIGNGWEGSGSAYVFVRDDTSWSQQAKIIDPDFKESDRFGHSVSISGNRALVGQFNADDIKSDAGAALIFSRNGTDWSKDLKLLPADGSVDDNYGFSVALDGNNIIIGVPNDDYNGMTNAGRAYLYYDDLPVISSLAIANDNSTLAVTFSEAVYNTSGGTGSLEISDFVLSITGGNATFTGGATSNYNPTSISKSGNTYTLGISYSGTPNGNETVNVNPAAADAIFDSGGNAVSTSQSNNSVKLNNTFNPAISSVVLADDNSTIAVTFNELVFNTNSGSGDLEANDFAFSISDGVASLGSAIPSSISKSDKTYTLGINLSGSPNGNETLTVSPVDDGIYDLTGNEASTSQSNNSVSLNKTQVNISTIYRAKNITTAANAEIVYPVDIDGDGDLDVIYDNDDADDLMFMLNTSSQGGGVVFNNETSTIDNNIDNVSSVHATDLDQDGDMDVLATSRSNDKVVWYENDGAGGFTYRLISGSVKGASDLAVADFDNDGDIDVISVANEGNEISWYENDGAADPNFTTRLYTSSAGGVESVFTVDLDRDGYMDFVCTLSGEDHIRWYQNNGDSNFGGPVIIASNLDGVWDIFAIDMNNDGDIDIVSAAVEDDKISLHDNNGSQSFTTNTITTTADGVTSIYPADIDNDGDIDILSAANLDNTISYYENNGSSNPSFTLQIISADVNRPMDVFAADLDRDGHLDILSASVADNKIAWYENTTPATSAPTFGSKGIHISGTNADQPSAVIAADLDGDGDQDILSASIADSRINWYKSDGAPNPGFVFSNIGVGKEPNDIFVIDVDRDGDLDVLSAEQALWNNGYSGGIHWYENDGAASPSFTRIEIQYSATDGKSVFGIDLDQDGDIDILSASGGEDKIRWYENDGGVDPSFTAREISNGVDGASDVRAIDVDGDGDLDVLSAGRNSDEVAWHENNGSQSFTKKVITTNAKTVNEVFGIDLDRDGDIDILSASEDDNKIAWYKNNGSESFTEYTIATGSSPYDVYAADLDNDGDIDVLSGLYSGLSNINWHINDGSQSFTQVSIENDNMGTDLKSVYAADLDNDGDLDVMGAFGNGDKVAWYKSMPSDDNYPYITSSSLADDNSTIAVTFSESVSRVEDNQNLEASDFSLSIMGGVAILGSATPNSIAKSGLVYTLGINLSGTPNGEEVITVNPLANQIHDSAGNIASASQNNNFATLNDKLAPTISSISIATDNSTIEVTMSEAVYNTNGGSGALEVSDFVFSVSGGAASLTSATPSSISVSGNVYTLGISLSGTANGSETLTVNPADDSIYDATGNEASTSQSNNTANLKIIGQYTAAKFDFSGDAISVGKLEISDTGTIIDIDVEFTLTMSSGGNTAAQYLNFNLLSPSGTPVKLINYNTLDNSTYETILDDEAATSIKSAQAPFTGRYKPENSLTYFDGESIKGEWQLVVSNTQGNWGTINWKLKFSSDNSSPTPVPNYGTEYVADQLSVGGDQNSIGKMTITDDVTITDLNLKLSFDMNNGSAYEYIRVTLKTDQITYYPFTESQFKGDMYQLILDDEAIKAKATSNDWTAPFIGAHQSPNNPLDSFDGLKANTEWQLIVTNNQGFTGNMNWSLLLNSDLSRPTVSLSSTESTNTGNAAIPIIATFNEYVNGFDSSDVDVEGGTLSSFNGSGTEYNFIVTPTKSGTVTVKIPENKVINKAQYGNKRVDSDSITFNYTKPVETLYVKKSGNDSNIGTIDNPFLTISKAINRAESKDSIIVYPGVYEEAVDFDGKNIVLASRYIFTNDTTYRDSTVIQGGVSMESLDSTAALIGFMIYKNQVYVNGGNPILKRLHIRENTTGGLLISNNAKLVINDLAIKSNSKGDEGGGIYIVSSKVELHNTTIDSNTSSSYGGGIYTKESYITINNSQINYNISNNSGGGIFSDNDSSFIMTNVTVEGDTANGKGGGICFENTYNSAALPFILKNVNVDRNIATGGLMGGGLSAKNVSLHINQSLFTNNTSPNDGGGFDYYSDKNPISNQDSIVINNTSFINNKSALRGAGARIYFNSYGKAYLSNVVFAQNTVTTTSASASGLHYYGAQGENEIKIINSTFAKNEGEYVIFIDGNGSKIVTNTIIWNNQFIKGNSIYGGNGLSINYSNLEEKYNGTGNINTDPNFVDLANGDYHLRDSSPSLGAGTLEGAPTTDIEGNPRPNPAGSNPDMGAYESSKSTRVTDTYYVMKSGNDQNNGSLSSPFLTIQRGVDAGYHGDTVIVYPGKYEEAVDFKKSSIVLASQFLSTNDSTYRDQTVIQGNVTMDSLETDAALIGFMIYQNQITINSGSPKLKRILIRDYIGETALTIEKNANVTIDNIEVKNNYNNNNSYGGGIKVLNSTLFMNNAIIDSNNVYENNRGGGIFSSSSHMTILNSEITNNFANNGGGISSADDSSYAMTNVKISNNSNSGLRFHYFGQETGNIATFDRISVENNSSGYDGGGMYIDGKNFKIINSSFVNNTVAFTNNNSLNGGGLYYKTDYGNNDTLQLENVSFIGNSCVGCDGGGAYIDVISANGNAILKNVLFSENKSEHPNDSNKNKISGLAILNNNNNDKVKIINNTFVNNIGEKALRVSTIKVEVINTIIWHNQSNYSDNSHHASISYSNIEDGNSGTGNINSDPLFVDLDNGDYSLQSTSPSIDSGHPDLDGDGETWETDTDDQDPDGTRMDMGSAWFSQLESEPPTIQITNIDDNTKFGSGGEQTIEWTATDNFRIDWTKLFLKAPGSTSFTLIDSVFGNPGTYDYQVPFKISKDYYIKISVSDPSGNTAADTQRFEVIDVTSPIVSLLKPSPNFKILEYDTLDIEWLITDNHLLDSTWIYYSIDNLANLTPVDSLKSGVLKYEYKIPAGVTKQAKIKIVSKDSTGNAGNVESALIEVLDNTQPTVKWTELDNKIFKIGTSAELKWTSSDNVGVDKVDLSYSKDQSTWIEIAKKITNQNKYNWQIANDPYNSVTLRVIGYDAVQLSDTSIMTGYTIKVSYPQITTTDVTSMVDWKTKEIKMIFDQPLDANSITNTNFTFSSQQNDTQVPSFNYDNNTKSITLTFKDGFISKDSLGITVSGGIKSFYGYLFDGDGDESPGGNYSFGFKSSLLGDYNYDSKIDGVDLAVLLNALDNSETKNELGPVEGNIPPHFKTIADGVLDIEDVMAFVRIWNWKMQNPNGEANDWIALGQLADIGFSHNQITVPMMDNAFLYEVEIKFMSGNFDIQSNKLPDALLKYYDKVSNTVYLTSEVEQDKINIPFEFSDRFGTVQLSYRLLDRMGDPVSQGSLTETIENVPDKFALYENYPNPFNPTTTLRFDIPEMSDIRLTIYNMLGQEVRVFDMQSTPAGYHSVTWDATNDLGEQVGAGVYLYQLQAKDFVKTKKMILLK